MTELQNAIHVLRKHGIRPMGCGFPVDPNTVFLTRRKNMSSWYDYRITTGPPDRYYFDDFVKLDVRKLKWEKDYKK